MTPIISIIIPTANRPQYLPRAIESSLEGMDPHDVEVIVIPNGPDKSWQESTRPFRDNHSVRVIPIKEANANIARNIGLSVARGEFVRFLDDDDYLISAGAVIQYRLIGSSGVDVVSGSLLEIDEKACYTKLLLQPRMDDLCTAVLAPRRRCLPTAHVYRRSRLTDARWNPDTQIRQDYEWLFELCAKNDLTWLRIDDIVGVWRHHQKERISTARGFNEIRKLTVPMFIKAYELLSQNGRLNHSRREAIALGLWDCVHSAFHLDPLHWSGVALTAMHIDPGSHPIQPIYSYPIISRINPLLYQWMILPKRWLSYQIQKIRKVRSR